MDTENGVKNQPPIPPKTVVKQLNRNIVIGIITVLLVIAISVLSFKFLYRPKDTSDSQGALSDSQLPHLENVMKSNYLAFNTLTGSSFTGVVKPHLWGPFQNLVFNNETTYYEVVANYTYGPKIDDVCGQDYWKLRNKNDTEINTIKTLYYYDSQKFLVKEMQNYKDGVTGSEFYYKEATDSAQKVSYISTEYHFGDYASSSEGHKSNLFSIYYPGDFQSLEQDDASAIREGAFLHKKETINGKDYFVYQSGYVYQCPANGKSITYIYLSYIDDNNKVKRNEIYENSADTNNLMVAIDVQITASNLDKSEADKSLLYSRKQPVYDVEKKVTETYGATQSADVFKKYISDKKPTILITQETNYKLGNLMFISSSVYPKFFGREDRNFYSPDARGDKEYQMIVSTSKNTTSNIWELQFNDYEDNITIRAFDPKLSNTEILNGMGIGSTDETPVEKTVSVKINGSNTNGTQVSADQISYVNGNKTVTPWCVLIIRQPTVSFSVTADKNRKAVLDFTGYSFRLLDLSKQSDLAIWNPVIEFYAKH